MITKMIFWESNLIVLVFCLKAFNSSHLNLSFSIEKYEAQTAKSFRLIHKPHSTWFPNGTLNSSLQACLCPCRVCLLCQACPHSGELKANVKIYLFCKSILFPPKVFISQRYNCPCVLPPLDWAVSYSRARPLFSSFWFLNFQQWAQCLTDSRSLVHPCLVNELMNKFLMLLQTECFYTLLTVYIFYL